jgi:hypothetical protein
MEEKMADGPFSLNDRVAVSDRAGVIGSGYVIGRTYQTPPNYDVRLDDGKMLVSVAAERVSRDE